MSIIEQMHFFKGIDPLIVCGSVANKDANVAKVLQKQKRVFIWVKLDIESAI
jgi:hypothetical protein